MDSLRSLDTGEEEAFPFAEEPAPEPPPLIGTDERRMHVRAYNHWLSLLAGRAYPSIDDLDPAALDDFGPHGVLLDFGADPQSPRIAYLGAALREECGLDAAIDNIADVPPRSLLSRLTDHFLEIIANRAPIGFEAEFVSHRGRNTLYRGILTPFSSDDATIDFIYGVINWKEVADAGIDATIAGELAIAAEAAAAPSPVWADGPGRMSFEEPAADAVPVRRATSATIPSPARLAIAATLADRLAEAREAVEAADSGDRDALHHALALAYEMALAAAVLTEDFAALRAQSGIAADADDIAAVAELFFGCAGQLPLDDCAAALRYGMHLGLAPAGFAAMLGEIPGGLGSAARAGRAIDTEAQGAQTAREALRRAPARATIEIASDGAEFVLLLGRREADGSLAVIAPLAHDALAIDRAIRAVAG